MAAPTLDAFSQNAPASGTTHNWSHTVGSGGASGKNLLLAFLHIDSASDLVIGATYNGANFDFADVLGDGTSTIYYAVWLNPSSGTHTISIPTSSACILDGAAVSYLNADQTWGAGVLRNLSAETNGVLTVTTPPVANCRVGVFAFNALENPVSVGGDMTLQISDKDSALATKDSVVTAPLTDVFPSMQVSTATRWQLYGYAVAEIQGASGVGAAAGVASVSGVGSSTGGGGGGGGITLSSHYYRVRRG